MRNIEAIIFDFDGVLVDSFSIWMKVNYETFDKLNLSLVNVEKFEQEICGMNTSAVARYYIDKYNVKLSTDEIEKIINETAIRIFREEVSFKSGVKEFLDFATKNELILAIASSNEKEIINECLIAHGLNIYFDKIVTSSEVKRHKPYPDVYLKAAEVIKVEPKDCLVFEDSLSGVLAGKSAGMTVFGMYDRLNDYSIDEIKSNCDQFFINFEEVQNFLKLKGAFYEKGFRKRA